MKKQPKEKKLRTTTTLLNILILLYRFRFLNRQQIQTILNHKKFNRIIKWLNDLTKQKYTKRYYRKTLNSEPAVYSLGTQARKYFLAQKDLKEIQLRLLNRVWKEYGYTQKFKKHCMFLADIYISLLELTKKNNAKLRFHTKVDLTDMQYMLIPEPDAYLSIEEKDGTIKRYFLEIIDYLPRKDGLRQRIEQYLRYHNGRYWQNNTGHPFPEVIMISADIRSNYRLKNLIRKKIKTKNMIFYLSTWGEIRAQGMRREALHKVDS